MNDSLYTDQILIEKCKKGDQEAFDLLVRRYENKVYQYAYRLTQNQEDAADVASETFIRMYNSLKNFRGESQLSTWLYRVVSNVFYDFRKKERSHDHLPLEIPTDEGESEMERPLEDPNSVDMDEHILKMERNRILMNAIKQLPEYQRVMVVLFHVEDRPYEEIAQIMDMPLGTVKSRLNRARAALREILEPHLELFGLEGSPNEQISR
ncbi:MAG: sigma-70 family RNA polymerase sigma factor [Fimbriimonadia bacterium]|nr:sigma-70 family RNA polymerase sigma factor [Fimbriimonadia bacterium]